MAHKKKVWSLLVYLRGGSGKTLHQINNTPHLNVCSLNVHAKQAKWCLYCLSLMLIEIYQISLSRIKAKHFHQYVYL